MSQTVIFPAPSVIANLQTQVAALQNVMNSYAGGTINFYLNGSKVTIQNPDPKMTLVDYLRYYTPYKGVKQYCRQGGCGVCTVMLSYYDQDSATFRNVSINSCLHLLVNCDGCLITTTEGIKTSATQYHPIQERIAKTYGFQCGACTTGIVMTQYTSMQPGTFMQRPTYQFLEKNFDGNLCRCSCYPGIIKMARSFLPPDQDGSPQVYNNINNSSTGTLLGWDLNATGPGSATTGADDGFYSNLGSSTSGFNQFNMKGFLTYSSGADVNATSNATISNFLQTYTKTGALFTNNVLGLNYFRATSIAQVINQIQNKGISNVELVSNATSYGVPGYERPNKSLFIDVNHIAELHTTRVTSTGAVFGANVPLNKVVALFFTGATTDQKWNTIANHFFYISGNHVRNKAALVGSLVMTKKNGFGGDVAPVLLAANASLECTYVYPTTTTDVTISVQDYLGLNTSDKYVIIKRVIIPPASVGEVFWSYRLAQRYFNSHAWLNCAASYTVTAGVISNPRIVYGIMETGAGVTFATGAMSYLAGKNISPATTGATGPINTIISGAISAIGTDINTQMAPIRAFVGIGAGDQVQDGKTAYRKNLGTTMWYLSFLNLLKSQNALGNYATIQSALETWISGTPDATRIPDVMYSQSATWTTTQNYPVDTPMPRPDAFQIAAGEVKYNDDIPLNQGTLWLAFAESTIPVGEVDWASSTTINSLATARASTGVAYVFTAQDFYSTVKTIALQNTNNIPGYTAITNYTGAISYGNNNRMELLCDKFISFYGQRIAGVLSYDQDIAKSVASQIVFGYTGINTTYARSITDALNRASSGPALNYVSDQSTSSWGVNNSSYTRSNTVIGQTFPYTGGNGAIELRDGTIQVSTTGTNLIPRSASMTGYLLPDGLTTIQTYTYTGPNGDQLPWSPFIVNSTGCWTAGKYHMALERETYHCYRDEMGTYKAYATLQSGIEGLNLVKNALGLIDSQLDIHARRFGGSFGQKLTSTSGTDLTLTLLACIVAQGAPVRYIPFIKEAMNKNGAEAETYIPYRIGFNETGAIQSLYITPTVATPYNVNYNWRTNANYFQTIDVGAAWIDVMKHLVYFAQNIPGVWLNPRYSWVSRPGRVAMRGPYSVPINYAWNHLMDSVAGYLNKSFTDVAYINAPQYSWNPGTSASPTGTDLNIIRNIFDRFMTEPKYDYTSRKAAVASFNATNKFVKRALEIGYGKYESFNWSGASSSDILIRITPNGEVFLFPAYTESGQGGTTKLVQMVADKLQCPICMIKVIECFDHNINYGNAGNGGSRGTLSMLRAADDACNKILNRFAPNLTGALNGDVYSYNLYTSTGTISTSQTNLSFLMTGNNGLGNPSGWKALVTSQCSNWAYYYPGTGGIPQSFIYPRTFQNYTTPSQSTVVSDIVAMGGTLYPYSGGNGGTVAQFDIRNQFNLLPVFAGTMTETEVNVLTGNVRIIRADIIGDVGNSPNPTLDLGQLYGGYIFSLGAMFKEERIFDQNTGRQTILDTWDYKPPCIVDIPQVFNVDFYGATGSAAINVNGYPNLLGGKDMNELTASAAVSAFFAAKAAVRAFRTQNGLSSQFDVFTPATPDRIQAAAGFTPAMLNMN